MVTSPKREACHCLSWPKEPDEGKRYSSTHGQKETSHLNLQDKGIPQK